MRIVATLRRSGTAPSAVAAVAGEADGTHGYSEQAASILSRAPGHSDLYEIWTASPLVPQGHTHGARKLEKP